MNKILVIALTTCLVFSSGSVLAKKEPKEGSMKDTNRRVAAASVQADAQIARQREQANTAAPYFVEKDELWIGANSVMSLKSKALPKVFETGVIFRRQWMITLNDIAEHVTANYGVPVAVTEDALKSAAETTYDAVKAMKERQQELGGGGMGQPQGGSSGGGAGGEKGQLGTFMVQYEGDLKGLLDQVTAKTGNSWRWENGRVVISHVETRIFQLDIQPGNQVVKANVGSDVQGGGSGEGDSSASATVSSGNATTMAMNIDTFTAAADAIKGMLSPKGKMVTTSAMGQLMITDIPSVLDQAGSLIERLNEVATRQVAIDVKVYSVDIDDSRGFGLDWNLVWKSIGSPINVAGASGANQTSGSTLGFTVTDPTSPFNGSSLIVDALARQGNVSTLTSANVTTLSGSAVPFQIAEETGYLKSSTTTLVPDVGSQTSVTPGTVTTGFSVVVVPTVTNNGDILMQMQLNLSALREIRKIGGQNGSTAIETPLVATRQVMQRVKVQSGQTLVVSGFEQEALRVDANGLGSPKFWLLGGGKTANNRRTTLVVVITPKVL